MLDFVTNMITFGYLNSNGGGQFSISSIEVISNPVFHTVVNEPFLPVHHGKKKLVRIKFSFNGKDYEQVNSLNQDLPLSVSNFELVMKNNKPNLVLKKGLAKQ